MLDAALLSDAKTLAYEVAPELRDQPLYIVDASVFDGLLSGQCDCLGWAADGVVTHYDFRSCIGDEWRGPGPIICLRSDEIIEEWPGEHFRVGVLNVLLHEISHVLPPASLPKNDCADLLDTPKIREWQRNKRVEAESLPSPEPGTPADWHGPQFVRVASHLWARSTLAGWNIPSFNLFGGACWYISQAPHFVAALLAEIVTMRTACFGEIVSRPPPEAFTELWGGCLNLYFNRKGNADHD